MGAGGEAFGELLRRNREAAALTRENLAERAGMSASAIGALERGERRRPYPHTVRALFDALGLSDSARAELLGAISRRHGAPDGRRAMVVVGEITGPALLRA